MGKNTILLHNKFGNGSMFNIWDTALPEEDCTKYVQEQIALPDGIAISGSVINSQGKEILHIHKN